MIIEQSIRRKLNESLTPEYLEVINESHMHNVAKGSETHFKVVLVSDVFDGMRPVKRHQKIYSILADELAGEVHALALHTYSPVEWQGSAPASPACRGGAGR
ncbi:BolA family protein [Salinibius halmophilus]|uniref:BolA family protein n=1 Tax=Salinibius halmophilus TaxID=1853216 RepID=UPI000E6654B8|nr:BolA/IbaG family iron-sulfur metabolism protein [Salinibius halmophilus]